MEDDALQLPADTLALLNQFRAEQAQRAELEDKGDVEISEDWQLSQFWYSVETAVALCQEAASACENNGSIACVSSPTLLQYFHEMEEFKAGGLKLKLFEYDDRFGKRYPTEFVKYDYNNPLEVPEELKGSFDVIIADPPFLADECLVRTAQTIRLLGKPGAKIILCTGAIMEEMAERLLSAKRTDFQPSHSNNLSNDFACFTNYTPKYLMSSAENNGKISSGKPLEFGNLDNSDVEDIQFDDATESAIKDMCRTEFCRPDLELTAHINELFPTEQSLTQLDSVIAQVEAEILDLDTELVSLVESSGSVSAQGTAALEDAHKAMEELERRIENIRGKTRSSDEIVREMTRDIKQLDVAKRNLTSSITTLHHLHILLTGVDSLGAWVEKRDYASIARQLPAILNVLQLFDGYREAEQISLISRKLDVLKKSLTAQLITDLKLAFQSGHLGEHVTDMCRVAAALEDSVRDNLCKWFISQQLSEYTVLYAENEEGAWLDKIDERYKWYVRKLTDFERTGLSKIFPTDWDMGRLMTKEFCVQTKDVLYRMMTRRRQDLEWKLLGHAIQHTKMFESLLVKRFPPKGEFNFEKAIWSVFDGFLDVFIAAQEKTLDEFRDGCSNKIRSGAERPSRESTTHAVPLPSSADMFLLLKKVITESSKLSSEPDALLKDVVAVVRSCLRGYAHGCLTAFLPSTSGQHIGASSAANLFNLMREESAPIRLSPDQQFLTCCILATADWCAETTLQLQEKLVQRLPGIDLNQEIETFYGITNQSLSVLVQDVEGACEPALQAVSKVNWSAVDGVGDESAFVGAIRSHLRQSIPVLRDLLSDRRKYFAHLCLKLATQLSHKFIGALLRSKPVSLHGAEQLLLDTHSLKSFLLHMPSVDSAIAAKPPTTYVNGVNAALNKAEMILKLVMSNMDSAEMFADHYSTLLPESNTTELQKILEMRGLKRLEQASILSCYRLKHGSSDPMPTQSSQLSASQALNAVVSMAADGLAESNSMKRLEKLVKRNL